MLQVPAMSWESLSKKIVENNFEDVRTNLMQMGLADATLQASVNGVYRALGQFDRTDDIEACTELVRAAFNVSYNGSRQYAAELHALILNEKQNLGDLTASYYRQWRMSQPKTSNTPITGQSGGPEIWAKGIWAIIAIILMFVGLCVVIATFINLLKKLL